MVLGLIHGLIGVVHQGLGVGAVIRIEGDPYAAGDAQRLLLKLEGVMQAVVQLVGDREGRGIRIGQHDDEFVPPKACHQIFFSDALPHALGHQLEQQVAGFVAEGVIDGLEVVEIDEDQGQGLLWSLLQGLLEPLLQQAAVGQAGEGVIEGEAAHHLFPGRTFGDIPGHPQNGVRSCAGAAMQGSDRLDGHQMTLLVAQLGVDDAPGLPMIPPLPGLEGGGDAVAKLFPGLIGEQLAQGEGKEFGGLIAAQGRDGGADVTKTQAVGVHGPDHVAAVLRHETVVLLALGQFPGEPLSVTGLFPQTQIEVQEDAEQGQQGEGDQHGDGHAPVEQLALLAKARLGGVVEEGGEVGHRLDHPGLLVGAGDLLPAILLHVTGLDDVGLHQGPGFTGLEGERLAPGPAGVVLQDQVDHLLGMIHGIAPPLEAGLQEALDPLLLVDDLTLRGEEVVSVEVVPDVAGAEHPVGNALLLQGEGFGCAVGADGVRLAPQQCLDPPLVGQGLPLPAAGVAMQVGEQLVGAGFEHQPLVGQIARGLDIRPLQGDEHQGGVLQHGGEHHHRAACCPGQQQIAAADAKLGTTRGDFIDDVGARPRLPQGDLQAGLLVEPLGDGGVVTGKLELVLPGKLQDDALIRPEVSRGQGGNHHPEGQKPAYRLARCIGLRHTAVLSGGALLARVKQFPVIRKGSKPQ